MNLFPKQTTLRHGYSCVCVYLEAIDSLRILSASPSSPKSVTTTEEQPTTLRAVPSLSTLARPTHSPRVLPSGTLSRSTPCSAHSASLQPCESTQSLASPLSSDFAHSCRPRRRPSAHRAFFRTALSAASASIGGSA